MSNYSHISDEELRNHNARMTSKAEGIRINILKQCDELASLYTQLLEMREELSKRESK